MQHRFDVFGEPVELLSGDGSARLYDGVFDEAEASALFERLHVGVPWQEHQVFVFGRWVAQPRLTAWFGDTSRPYRYSGNVLQAHPWTAELEAIRQRCEELAGASFNSALANLYRDGSDSVSWHADDEPELGSEPVIASVSLGAPRRFDLRHRASGETVRVDLSPGSVLVMSGQTQHCWIHQIPKTRSAVGPRINLTYRWIHG